MAMTTDVRNQLLRIHQQERDDSRCAIAKRLNIQAKELTKEVINKKSALESEIEHLEADIRKHRESIHDYNLLRDNQLKDAKLFNIGETNMSGCDLDGQHPDLIEFDHETRDLRKAILNRT